MVIKRVDARRFRSRWSGFTLAEVLVMIVLTASALLPVIGTMHTGVERTVTLEHKARMRTICESWLNHSIASAAYMRQPIGKLSSHTISWPDTVAPLATFIINLDMVENVIIASLPGGLAGDFPQMPVSGVQPTHIKAVVVSVYLQNDDVDSATEVVKLGALVSLPRSSVSDRLFIANDQREVMALDPVTGNVLETYALPFRPGNIALHPSGKYLAIQASKTVQVLNVDLSSPNCGTTTTVFAPGNFLIVDDSCADGIQKARGIVFRPDGRRAFVTCQNDGVNRTYLDVLTVPDPPTGAWTSPQYLQLSGSVINVTDMTVGQDGYVYLCLRGSGTDKVQRINMYLPSIGLLDFFDPGVAAAPLTVAPTPDGRHMITGNLDRTLSRISSDIPANYSNAGPLLTTNFGPAHDVMVTPDGKKVLFTNSSYSGILKPRICSIDMSPTFGLGTYTLLATGSTDMIMLSPDRQKFVFILDDACAAWVDLIGSFTAGLLTAANTRQALLSRTAVARPVSCAVRTAEYAVVACGDGAGNNSLEIVDVGMGAIVDTVTLAGSGVNPRTPQSVCLDGGGAVASVAYQDTPTGKMYVQGIDVTTASLLGSSVDVNPAGHVNWQGPVSPTLGGGCVVAANDDNGNHAFLKVYAPGNPTPVLAASLTACTMALPYPVCDIAQLNGGGAMILVNDLLNVYTQLYWIGKDNTLFAKWDSRYDAFPPEGATRIAVSAADGLIAFYDPTYLGAAAGADNHKVRFYDMRAQSLYGTLTQMNGLIEIHQSGTSGNFRTGPKTSSVDCRFTGSGLRLIDAFTCNHPNWASATNYPGNYVTPAGTSIYDDGATRMFGYYYPTGLVQRFLNVHDDYGRLILDGNEFRKRANWWTHSALFEDWFYPVNPVGPVLFQMDNSNVAANAWQGVFSTTDLLDAAAVPVPANRMYPAPAGSWQRLASPTLHPMRLTPQFIDEFDTPDLMYSDNGRIVFARDTASPTVYFLNRQNSKLSLIQWGRPDVSYSLAATISAGLAAEMALTPDGQRLLVTATSPARLCVVDIAQPPSSTFGKVVSVITLPRQPRAVATRPFVRYGTIKDRWECVATLTLPVSGQHIAAIAYGGVNIVGGAPSEAGVATTDAYRLNPLRSTVENVSPGLASPAARHAVVPYDGEFYSFLGRAGGNTLTNVQRWNPMSQRVLGAAGEKGPDTLVYNALPQPAFIWLRLDETSGGTASDSSGNARHQTVTFGGGGRVPGKYGNCVNFTSDTWIEIAKAAGDCDTAITICCWVKTASKQGTTFYDVAPIIYDDTAGSGDFGFGIAATGKLMWGMGNGGHGDVQMQGTANNIANNNWHHVAAVWDQSSNDGYLYVDGVLDAGPVTLAHHVLDCTQGMRFGVGYNYDAAYSITGQMDDLQIYQVALTAAEVVQAMNIATVVPGVQPPCTDDVMSGVENDSVASQARHDFGACLTPYGIVMAGGMDGGTVKSESFVYWPHGVATLTYPPDTIGTLTSPMTAPAAPSPLEATSSGYGGGDAPWKSFNANTGDGWKSDAAVCWIRIDLGAPYAATKVDVYGRGSAECPKRWNLWGSNVDTWTSSGTDKFCVASISGMPQSAGQYSYGLAGAVPYRYYRLDVLENWGDAGKSRINEIVLFGAAPPPLFKQVNATMTSDTQPAPNKISVSNMCNNHRPSLALNGKTNDYGHINTNANGWIQVDLAQPEVLSKFEIMGVGDSQDVRRFMLWGANTLTWNTAASATVDPDCYCLVDKSASDQASSNNWNTYTFGNTMAFKYYRLMFSANHGHPNQTKIREMRFWGQAYKPLVQWGISRQLPSMSGNQPGPTGNCAGHSLVYHSDGHVYRIGGAVDGAYNVCTNILRFDFATNAWQPVAAPTQLRRTKAAACSFGDEIFIFGGATGAGPAYTDTAAAWNPTTNAVRNLPTIPWTSDAGVAQARRTFGSCAVPCGPVIYLIGGANSTGGGGGRNILAYYP